MNAQINAVGRLAAHAQVFDAVAQLFGIFNVVTGDLADAFGKATLKLQRNTVRNGRQNGQLVRRVDTFHVECRIGFGVPQLLSFF